MQSKKNDKEVKRAYEKPKLLTIELMLKEVLAVGCKSEFLGGSGAAPCEFFGGCPTDGS